MQPGKPSRARYLVVASLFVLALITYIDRACISSAKDAIAVDFALTNEAMGAVFGAFALGYALAQLPLGYFADRVGPRLALGVIVVAWSGFTALTAAATGLASLLAIRFLFGIAEAGAFPASARAVYNWLPPSERGRANGILFSGSRVGAAVAFPLLATMQSAWGWRGGFQVLGAIGVVWSVVWLAGFRNHPAVAPEDAGTPRTGGMTLGQVLRSRGMALAMAQYFASNFTFFLCLSWMLPYLKQRYQLTNGEAAAYSMVPLLLGATAQWVAGFFVDALYRSRQVVWSRRLPAMAGFFLAAAGLVALIQARTPAAAAACFALAAFGADMTVSPSWVYCTDVGGKNSGAVSGCMNMLGNFGSFVSATVFPYLYSSTGSAAAYFWIAATLNVFGIACWLAMKSVSRSAPQLSGAAAGRG